MRVASRTLMATALVLLAGLVVTAVIQGRQRASGGAEAQPTPVPTGSPIAVIRLPLDSYQLSGNDLRMLAQAHIELVRRCLGEFEIDLPAPPQLPTRSSGSLHDRRYGLLHPDAARVLGYRPPGPTHALWHPDQLNQPQVRAILDGKISSFRGRIVPSGGCAGAVTRSLGGNEPTTDLAQRLSTESFATSVQHAEVKAVFGRWAECMQRAGYDYADPIAVASDPAFGSASVGQTEIAIALSDISCKVETDLVEVWNRVEADLQQQLISANRPVLEAERNTNHELVAKARRVLVTP